MIFFIPKIFSLMTLIEKYELPQRSLYMTLVRTVCLYGVVLGNLLWYWATTLRGGRGADDDDDSDKVDEGCKSACWENEMGQEIYALVIMDFVMALLDSLVTDFLRSVTVRIVG